MAQLNSLHRVFGVYGHAIPMNHIQTDATQICNQSDIIDLHLDTWIPKRLWGYHPNKRHRRAIFGRHFFGHSDVPRLLEAGVTGAMWSITTNPFKLNNARWLTFLENLRRLEQFCADWRRRLFRCPGDLHEKVKYGLLYPQAKRSQRLKQEMVFFDKRPECERNSDELIDMIEDMVRKEDNELFR